MTSITRLLRPIALTLVITITATSSSQAAVKVSTPMDTATLHQKLTTRGIGKGVKITQMDGTIVKGTLVTIDADSFQVTPKNATQPTRVLNAQVTKFSNDGLSTGAKVGIGIAIGVVLVLAIAIISSRAAGPQHPNY